METSAQVVSRNASCPVTRLSATTKETGTWLQSHAMRPILEIGGHPSAIARSSGYVAPERGWQAAAGIRRPESDRDGQRSRWHGDRVKELATDERAQTTGSGRRLRRRGSVVRGVRCWRIPCRCEHTQVKDGRRL